MLEKLVQQKILSTNETEVYNLLLKNGPQYLSQLVKKTSIKRSTLADSLNSLTEKKLIEIEKKNRPLYKPLSPQNINDLVQQKKNELSTIEIELSSVIPDMIKQFNMFLYGADIKFINSLEGVEQASIDIVKSSKEILFFSPKKEDVWEILSKESFIYHYDKLRKKLKVPMREILIDTPETRKYQEQDAKHYRQTKLIPQSEEHPLHIEKDIGDDKVLIIFLEKKEVKAILIESWHIAQSEKATFNTFWNVF